MSEIAVRKATEQDDEALLDIYNSIHFDWPPFSVAEYRSMRARQPRGTIDERYAVEVDGRIAGSLEFWEASLFRQEGAVRIFLEVAEPFRRRGIGERLFRLMEERMPALGLTRAYAAVREDLPEALAFGERRGFKQTGQIDRASRLDVRLARIEHLAAVEERLQEDSIRITALQDLGMDDTLLHAFHQMENEASRDMPSVEGRADRTFDEWKAAVIESPGRSPATIWLALDGGRPVGVARLNQRAERAAVNNFTGVARAYRGRGIARALKRRTVLWARQSGINYLYTGNDMENRPMIAINDELGYQVLPAEIELVKEYAR
jgi:GNAT superfamily N-acetyltransferase